ncbi:MAG: Gfo/Idh/MocA family oxidoreductase [Planctomycetota bacterium]|nr:Gfo/Idh/MocA family oxidoreductase [Planctomycetota bacterium]
MSQEPIRYGVIGLGRAGWDIHVAGLRNRPDAKIVAVADPVADRRNEAASAFGCKTYSKIGQLLTNPDVEVAVIATPSALHGPDSKRAFKAGKHVVVEKPASSSRASS